MNRDRGKWVGPLKGVHVTMYTAWHAWAVLLWTAAIKTTCQFHSFVDGHLGYSHVLGWEERKSSRLMAKGEIFHPRREVGWWLHQKVQALDTRSHRLEPQELVEKIHLQGRGSFTISVPLSKQVFPIVVTSFICLKQFYKHLKAQMHPIRVNSYNALGSSCVLRL